LNETATTLQTRLKAWWPLAAIFISYFCFVGYYLAILQVPLSVDQSFYLLSATKAYRALQAAGIDGFFTTLLAETPHKPLLFYGYIAASFTIFGVSEFSPIYLNVLVHTATGILLLGFLRLHCTSATLGVSVAALYLFFPYINGMVFDHFPEFLLGAIVFGCFVTFLHWFPFAHDAAPRNLAPYVVLGAWLGLAFLAKQTAILFLAPIFVVLLQRFLADAKRRWALVLSAVTCAAVASLWYVPNFPSFWHYSVHHTVTDNYRVPVPIMLYHVFWYALTPLYFIVFTLAVVAAAAAWRTLGAETRKALLLVGAGIFLPFLALMLLSTNRQARFLYPAVPLCALFIGLVAARIAPRFSARYRQILAVAAVAAAAANLAYYGGGLREYLAGLPAHKLSGLPRSYSFNGAYLKMPLSEPGLKLVDLVEQLRRRNQGRPVTIMFLNTYEFLVAEYTHWQALARGWEDRIFRVSSQQELETSLRIDRPDYVIGWDDTGLTMPPIFLRGRSSLLREFIDAAAPFIDITDVVDRRLPYIGKLRIFERTASGGRASYQRINCSGRRDAAFALPASASRPRVDRFANYGNPLDARANLVHLNHPQTLFLQGNGTFERNLALHFLGKRLVELVDVFPCPIRQVMSLETRTHLHQALRRQPELPARLLRRNQRHCGKTDVARHSFEVGAREQPLVVHVPEHRRALVRSGPHGEIADHGGHHGGKRVRQGKAVAPRPGQNELECDPEDRISLERLEEQREAAALEGAVRCRERKLRLNQVMQDGAADHDVEARRAELRAHRVGAHAGDAVVEAGLEQIGSQYPQERGGEIGGDDPAPGKQAQTGHHRVHAGAGADIENFEPRRRGPCHLGECAIEQAQPVLGVGVAVVIGLRPGQKLIGDSGLRRADFRGRNQDTAEPALDSAEIDQFVLEVSLYIEHGESGALWLTQCGARILARFRLAGGVSEWQELSIRRPCGRSTAPSASATKGNGGDSRSPSGCRRKRFAATPASPTWDCSSASARRGRSSPSHSPRSGRSACSISAAAAARWPASSI
jgi:4-amino-4-deoxy-L-arabinose transferase-like glycosyltransferase